VGVGYGGTDPRGGSGGAGKDDNEALIFEEGGERGERGVEIFLLYI
jgi:hypothetical protein